MKRIIGLVLVGVMVLGTRIVLGQEVKDQILQEQTTGQVSGETKKLESQKNIPTFVSSETEALFSQAIEYHRDGKLSKARAEAKKVINSYPENKEVLIYGYRLLNWISFDEQKFDQCIKEGELCLKNWTLAEESSKFWKPPVITRIALSYFSFKEYGKTINLCKEMLLEYPDSDGGRVAVSLILKCYRAMDKSSEIYSFLKETSKNFYGTEAALRALMELRDYYRVKGEHLKAIELLQTVDRNYPECEHIKKGSIFLMMAEHYFVLKEWQKALTLYEKVLTEYKDTSLVEKFSGMLQEKIRECSKKLK